MPLSFVESRAYNLNTKKLQVRALSLLFTKSLTF